LGLGPARRHGVESARARFRPASDPAGQRWTNPAPLRAERIRAHLAGETPAYEVDYRVRHDDGQYRWVRVRALCVRDARGEPSRMAGSVVDIDAQRRAEEARRLSEERYAIAMTGSDEAHWVWNVKTDELFSSPQLHRLTGVEGEPPATRSEWRARVPMHADDRERTQRAVDLHLAGLTPRLHVEFRVVDPANGEALDLQPRPVLPRRRRPAGPHGEARPWTSPSASAPGGALRESEGGSRARSRAPTTASSTGTSPTTACSLPSVRCASPDRVGRRRARTTSGWRCSTSIRTTSRP
jgi:PAS domain-containing protein